LCFAIQIALANPEWGAVIRGFAPTTDIVRNPDMLYLAIGIIGATVMPHNLFLHSGVVQTRRYGESVEERREAIKLATVDSTIALMFALLINASILILAARTFNKTGQTEVAELGEVHKLIAPLLGSGHGARAVRDRAAVLRPELDRHGHARGPDRDGGFHRYPPAALGAAADHARHRDRAGRRGDDLVR
jgi:Mn2+/Fe2+ NRAMP family transporter